MRNYFVWICVFAVTALTLYDLKYNVRSVQKETERLEQELIDEKRRLATLEVEWVYVSRPERIKALANRHLQLEPINTTQMIQAENSVWNASHVMMQQPASEGKR
jgi:cell division protein FtsL